MQLLASRSCVCVPRASSLKRRCQIPDPPWTDCQNKSIHAQISTFVYSRGVLAAQRAPSQMFSSSSIAWLVVGAGYWVLLARADFIRKVDLSVRATPAVDAHMPSPTGASIPLLDAGVAFPLLDVVPIPAPVASWLGKPGRCCAGRVVCPSPDVPPELCPKVSADTCEECTDWGITATCHDSEMSCKACGSSLYCDLPTLSPPPPPQTLLDTLSSASPPATAGSAKAHSDGAAPPAGAVWGTSPPPPPPSPPGPPVHWALGRQHFDKVQHAVSCVYVEDIEFVVQGSDTEDGLYVGANSFKDRKVATQEKCCELCAHDVDCADFVFDLSMQACVLLPYVDMKRIEQVAHPGVVSGTAKISAASPPPRPPPTVHCAFFSGIQYAGGVLPTASKALSGQHLTQHECCTACSGTKDCGKFSYDVGSGKCILHRLFAQPYIIDAHLQDTLFGGQLDSSEPPMPLPPGTPITVFGMAPASPLLTSFAYDRSYPSPPSLVKEDSEQLQSAIAVASASAGGFILCMFAMCGYCFFSPQLLTMLYKVSNGRFGRMHIQPQRLYNAGRGGSSTVGSTVSEGGKPKRPAPDSVAKVTVHAQSMVRTKEVNFVGVEGVGDIRTQIFSEFGALLKGTKPSSVLIFCLVEGGEGDGDGDQAGSPQWLLVTPQSSIQLVMRCSAFMLLPKEDATDPHLMEVAFPKRQRGGTRDPSTGVPLMLEDKSAKCRLHGPDPEQNASQGAEGNPTRLAAFTKCEMDDDRASTPFGVEL